MPIYAYKCESCGHAKDVLQKMSDAPLSDCPACGAPAFRKQLTAAGFQLKGSGWYATDFRNGGSKPPASGEAKTADGGETKAAEGKSGDAKTADAKTGDSKSSDSKPATDGKAAESKPAKAPAAPAASAGAAR